MQAFNLSTNQEYDTAVERATATWVAFIALDRRKKGNAGK